MPKDQLKKVYVLRRILNPMGTMDAIEFLIDKLKLDQDQRRLLLLHEHVAPGLDPHLKGPLHRGRFCVGDVDYRS